MLVKKTGIKHIEFTDSTFNIPLDHSKEVLRAIIEKKLNFELHTMGINPSAVDIELVKLMKESGLRSVNFGVEAGCNEMLKSLGKNFTSDDIIRSAKLLHNEGFPLLWYLLIGAPGESPHTIKDTFNNLDKAIAPWDFVSITLGVRVYKGSPIANKLLNENPNITTDNFLKPFILPLKEMEFSKLYKIVEKEASRYDNYYVRGEIREINPMLYYLINKTLKILASNKPYWRIYILVRKMKRALRLNVIKKSTPENNNWYQT